jgi:hypothetical protein
MKCDKISNNIDLKHYTTRRDCCLDNLHQVSSESITRSRNGSFDQREFFPGRAGLIGVDRRAEWALIFVGPPGLSYIVFLKRNLILFN